MPTRVPALRTPPIAFAHRGARAQAPENTLEAFTLAQRLGATGLESDVWLTADGEPVLDHDGLYATCGTGIDVSLDVKDPAAFDPVVAVARAAGDDALSRLWLCHPRWEQVVEWRGPGDQGRLGDSPPLDRHNEGGG